MDVLLHEWIGATLVVFPLFICELILLMGYGEKILEWIRRGGNMINENEHKK